MLPSNTGSILTTNEEASCWLLGVLAPVKARGEPTHNACALQAQISVASHEPASHVRYQQEKAGV